MKASTTLRLSQLLGWMLGAAMSVSSASPVRAAGLVDLEPRWKAGEHADYVLTKHGVVTEGFRVAVDTTNTTPVHVEVLSAGPGGYLVGWTQGETHFDDSVAASMTPLMKKMAQLMAGHRLELRLDRSGRLEAVQNWTQLREMGDAFERDVGRLLMLSGVDAARREQVGVQIRAMFSSERSVRLSTTRDAQLLLRALGHALDPRRPLDIEVVVPDPAGSDELRVGEHFELKAATDSSANVQWAQTGGAAQVGGNAVIDRHSGWPSLVSETVSGAANGARRTETTSLQRK
jgi:hypothetical protein